ncbi:MAG TPA: N-acetylmuramic acid 6-phosphate etherase, partial [Planctomycetota bacterium]
MNYGKLLTEQRNPRTTRIDAMSTSGILRAINREDATVAGAVRKALPAVEKAVELLVKRLRRGGRLIFVGAGTSGRLGVLEAAELPPTFGVPRDLARAVMAGGPACVWASKEGAEDDAADGGRQVADARAVDVVIGVAASGVTPFVHGALDAAKRRKAGRVLVACAPAPRSAADVVIVAKVGPEVIAGSTRLRAGTATKMVLNMLTVTAMIRLGKVYENLMVDLRTTNAKLVARAVRITAALARTGEAEAGRAIAVGGSVKAAVVMLRLGVGRAAAERRL